MERRGNFFGTEVTEAMGDGGQPVYIHSPGAIRLAQENAARLGHCYVGSEHLLLGLACQEYSLAARLLGEAGADSRSCGRPLYRWWAPGRPVPHCARA